MQWVSGYVKKGIASWFNLNNKTNMPFWFEVDKIGKVRDQGKPGKFLILSELYILTGVKAILKAYLKNLISDLIPEKTL